MNRRKLISVAQWTVLATVVGVIAVLLSIVVVGLSKAADERAALREYVEQLSAGNDSARAQGADIPSPEEIAETIDGVEAPPVGAAGERGDVGPAGPQGETGPQGVAGRTPTREEVLAVVAEFCGGSCVGPAGADGPVGAPGADGQSIVGPAGEDGQTGPPGPAGADGQDGTDGTNGVDGAPGPAGEPGPTGATGPAGDTGPAGVQGPAPTAEQIAAAVAAYCDSHNQCQGPQGPPGETLEPEVTP